MRGEVRWIQALAREVFPAAGVEFHFTAPGMSDTRVGQTGPPPSQSGFQGFFDFRGHEQWLGLGPVPEKHY
jgi:hypothetical protein